MHFFTSDWVKIHYIMYLAWAQAASISFDRFDHAGLASDRLFMLRQGALLLAEYAVEFGEQTSPAVCVLEGRWGLNNQVP